MQNVIQRVSQSNMFDLYTNDMPSRLYFKVNSRKGKIVTHELAMEETKTVNFHDQSQNV